MNAEAIISAFAGVGIALLLVLPTSRMSFLIVGPLWIVVGVSAILLHIGTWHGPLAVLVGVGGLVAYAYQQRKERAKGDI